MLSKESGTSDNFYNCGNKTRHTTQQKSLFIPTCLLLFPVNNLQLNVENYYDHGWWQLLI